MTNHRNPLLRLKPIHQVRHDDYLTIRGMVKLESGRQPLISVPRMTEFNDGRLSHDTMNGLFCIVVLVEIDYDLFCMPDSSSPYKPEISPRIFISQATRLGITWNYVDRAHRSSIAGNSQNRGKIG